MEWEQSQNGRMYTGTTHIWQAMIWKTTTGEWSALVSQHQNAVAHDGFAILKDARAWCETQIVEITLDSQRSTGAHIITHNKPSGFHDYLDDEPISAGASVDLYTENVWVAGRYETNVQND
jgi:hypothetical protein